MELIHLYNDFKNKKGTNKICLVEFHRSYPCQIFILKNHRMNCKFLTLVATSSMISLQKTSSDRRINVGNETVLPVKQLPST